MNKVLITGFGAITGTGNNTGEILNSIKANHSGIGKLKKFNTSITKLKTGCEVRDFRPSYNINHNIDKYLTDTNRFALHAACEAMDMANLNNYKDNGDFKTAVITGVSTSGMQNAEKFYFERHENKNNADLIRAFHSSVTADLIAWYFKTKGEKSTIITACSSGANAIGYAFNLIKSGEYQRVITGGSDALCFLTHTGFNSLGNVDPDYAKPFSGNRNGLSLGEGAGILILESEELVKNRNAKVYAEICGYGNTSDAYHATAPHPQGLGAARAMQQAINDAGLSPGQINYINAHGTGTIHNDKSETAAIKNVFNEHAYKLKVSSTKSSTGHTLGAAGAIEAVICVLAINNGIIPATLNYEEQDEDCDLDYVVNKHSNQDIEYALSNSFAFGGNNASLLFGKV